MKKHILIVSQYFYPEQFRINDIATELVKKGYIVTVVTGIPNYPQGRFYEGYGILKKRREKWNGIDIIRLPLIPRGDGIITLGLNYLSFPLSGFVWNIITKLNVDMVFMFETSPMNQCKIGVKYAKKHKVPCYLYVQDLWPESVEAVTGIRGGMVINLLTRMTNKIYEGCDYIFATSPSFVDAINARIKGNLKTKVSFLPQYAESFYTPFINYNQIEKCKKEYGIQTDCLNIIFTGNIGVAQGLQILPKVAQKMEKCKIKNVNFIIVGDGRAKNQLIEEIRVRGCEHRFIMISKVSPTEIPKLLACADVAFISFSDEELFKKTIPAKLQSYMACAMPILAAVEGETMRVITEAQCGLCSKINDIDGLVYNIQKYVSMGKDEMRWYAQNSYDYNQMHFDKNVVMDKLEKYIEAI